ncbi:tail fiber domain-containing protein [[Clostridium] innocuum]|uniref:tail fiber domain-containing protein n=1 Tax=Clostridium innocuum TaxID=1522 RepID=UPI001C3802F4|nr:tail fiber domain-containing protein [[Clostridium] innocuum]MBV4070325.1 tail fiber domain-containing protein [[Clostridium] innocuum]MCR0243989.1 tail fiber domain-containing protein [[Clostridium] innocuum]
MITTSDKYKTAISKSGRHFRLKIDIAGTAYTGIKSFKLKGGTNSSEQITFGDAVSSYIEFILTDVPKNTILKGRQAIPYIGLELDDGTVEWIKKGVYNLEKPVRSGEFIKLTAYDNFALCYKGFFTALSGNQKIVVILQEQCKKIGIEYAGGADDVAYNVDTLQGLTIIEAVSVLASYCGKNAIMDKDGKLRLVWYTDAGLTISPSRFADPLEMDEEDTFMNRLDCAIDEEHSVSAGTGVGIYFSCPGMTQERIAVLHNRIKGFTYRAAKLNWRMAQPDVEAGDLVRVMDNAGNVYAIPLMDYEFNCDGGFYGTIQSKGKTEQEQDTGYKGPLQTKVDRTYSDLVSTKQVITDKITAFEGEFETINTNYLEVNKKLSALDAEIENLDVTELATKVAKIETSYVSKEYVQDLYATKAEVHVLDVDLERVNTLLAGSVTAGSTQTIVLNADNTTISNALIKSAMIDSVAADKVTAGTIDASSIHFKSQSGRLDIYGETLQIKDITRPRVQIGKDASGDYNMYVWDAAGKLMFDAAGITASGIQRPIIVDSMVADNANISGDKINITSLVKEINDGTEVIKSSHILVDGANQSLSVVYNTIIGDISTLSTALSVEQGKISSLITDMSLAKGDVSTLQTNYSSLTQTVSGINSTVGEHTSTLTSVTSKQTQLEQTVNGFSGRISSIETTANNASSKVTEITATVNGLTTTVANKTDKGAIISTINQSAEAIKIQASKLELTGYVTMTNLSTSGQTSIDGGNIKTRTITAAKIASGTITATQIAANTITGAKIASKTITADKISVTSLSALTANLGTVTAGSLTSNTTISVSTNLTVGNNIYLNQNVNTTKYIYFNSSNYIRNLYTNSYNYITVNSNYRCALMSGSTSVYAYGNTGEAGISAAASIIFSSYGNGRLEHYGKYYDANWSSGFFRPLQAGTALGGSGASYRWYRLYAANTCSTSSDIRLKTNVKKYDVRYESMYMDLKPVTYELISTPGKTQCGLIAQWVKEAMDKNGISENEFALYEHDIREDSYSISYEQLTSLNMHMVQKTIKRVDAIDDELLSIKASRQQDAQELQQELQKRDFEISQLQYRIQQLESRS